MSKGYLTREVVAAARHWQRLLLTLALLLAFPVWGAGGVLVIGDTSRAYVNSFTSSLTATLGYNGLTSTVIDTSKFDATRLNGTQFVCIVTVGNHAGSLIPTHTTSIPVLHALVTESYARERSPAANGQTPRLFLMIDQPLQRMVLLAKVAMPVRNKVGTIYGPRSVEFRNELKNLVSSEQMQLIEKEINDPVQLANAVSYITNNADLLLTLPDPMVVNEGNAKTLILGTYMGNIPLLGFSQALVKAGALMAVHSTPEQLGRQSGELISRTFWKDSERKQTLIHPRYFQVSVNYQVARALQIVLPSEDELRARLERLEMSR